VNNPTLTEFCFGMIGRADIEGSKSNVAMNAWLPQASSVIPAIMIAQSFLDLYESVDDHTLSGGRSPYLRCIGDAPTPWRALNRLTITERLGSQVSCGLSLFFEFLPIHFKDYTWRYYHPSLVSKTYQDFPASRCVAGSLMSTNI
jgi:hypothetical protein